MAGKGNSNRTPPSIDPASLLALPGAEIKLREGYWPRPCRPLLGGQASKVLPASTSLGGSIVSSGTVTPPSSENDGSSSTTVSSTVSVTSMSGSSAGCSTVTSSRGSLSAVV